MTPIAIEYERLRRHYEVAVRTYDLVSLLDLSHALRMWTELRTQLATYAPKFASSIAFKTARPLERIKRAIREKHYAVAYFPDGVHSYAAQGQIASPPAHTPMGVDTEFAVEMMFSDDGRLTVFKYLYICPGVGRPMYDDLSNQTTKHCNFAQYLDGDAVRVSFADDQGATQTVTISREMMVKRVANTLGGSHASGEQNENGVNQIDAAVRHLLGYTVCALPLPYIILLKIAQDILTIGAKFNLNQSAHGAG